MQLSAMFVSPPTNQFAHAGPRLASIVVWYGVVHATSMSRSAASQNARGSFCVHLTNSRARVYT